MSALHHEVLAAVRDIGGGRGATTPNVRLYVRLFRAETAPQPLPGAVVVRPLSFARIAHVLASLRRRGVVVSRPRTDGRRGHLWSPT